MKLKKLLWLTDNFPPQRGGMAQSCSRIVYNLRGAGYEIHVVHFVGSGQPEQLTKWVNGSYQAIAFQESEGHTLNVAWHKIRQKENVYGVVSFGGYLSMLALPVYSKWLEAKSYLLLRGNDFDQSLFTPRKKLVLDAAIEGSSGIGVVSQDKIDRVAKLYPTKQILFTPNSIDLTDWQYSKADIAEATAWRQAHLIGRKCIGFFGDLKAKKGLEYFLKAAQPFKDKLHFLLVGLLPEEIRIYLTQESFHFTCLPFLDRVELLPKYLMCDAVALPSWYDGMPNVLLEGGALATPFIASNVDGMKDVLTNDNSYVFQVGEIDSCREILYTFIQETKEGINKKGKELATLIASRYTLQNEQQSYEKLFTT